MKEKDYMKKGAVLLEDYSTYVYFFPLLNIRILPSNPNPGLQFHWDVK